jgi:hypothetical protein
MKYFAGFALGVAMTISMMYDYFSVFCILLFASFVLALSVCKPMMDDEGKKKSASARQH